MQRLTLRILFAFAVAIVVSAMCCATTDAAAKTAVHKMDSAVGEEEHAEGVPLSFNGDLAIWSLIVFILFVIVLRVFAWGPLSDGLNMREHRIREDIATAESGRKEVERMIADHRAKLDAAQDEVREILAEARRDAEHAKQEIVSTAQSEAEALKQRSLGEIERAKDAALNEMFETMSSQISQATEFVLGRSVTGDDQDRLIQEAMSQFSQ